MPSRWLALTVPAAALMLFAVLGPLADVTWTAPRFAFWTVLVITVLCAIGAVYVVAIAWRRALPEVAILGSVLLAVSVLPLAHGLAIPGVLYGPNTTASVAALISVPVGMLIALPLIFPGLSASRAVGAHWRAWSVATMCMSVALAAFLLAAPNAFPAPQAGEPVTDLLIVVSLAGTLQLSLRQLRLYRIGHRKASLAASAAFVYLGLSTLVFLTQDPFTVPWWAAHVADATGVFGAIFGLAIAHHRDRSLAPTLAPVINRDPLIALELGLTPIVHGFVAALERKDPQTRDHVVRVGELAMRSGAQVGLPPEQLRATGLAALLHDVGKLLVPDEILKKPGALTTEEFETIKDHTVVGSQMLASTPLLAGASDLVRWHHERLDGSGYPDGLRDDQIPFEAKLIAVCDAWDAMTCNRHYRAAMDRDRAREILRDGAGTQWDGGCVEIVLATIESGGEVTAPVFSQVGRERAAAVAIAGSQPIEVCADAIPPAAREALGMDRPLVA